MIHSSHEKILKTPKGTRRSHKAMPLPDPAQLCAELRQVLEDKKATQVVTIDLRGKSNISDYLIIATGQSSRQLAALAEHMVKALKTHNIIPGVEGLTQGDWILVDGYDVIIHLFRPETRLLYNLERMWGDDIPPSP